VSFDTRAHVRGIMRNLKVTGSVYVPWAERSKLPDPGEEPFVMLPPVSIEAEIFVLGRSGDMDYRRGDDDGNTVFMFRWGDTVAQIGCLECNGTGWWGYGPTPAEQGECVACKGTGRVWVGLL
jgi:hypothetical protein